MSEETKPSSGSEAPGDTPRSETTPPPSREGPQEIGGRKGPDPTRYGDWEINGRCIDF